MFEQSFVRPQSRARTGWTVMVSTGLQVVMIGAGIVVPLLSPDLLPQIVANAIYLAPPGPPPGRAPAPERAVRPRAEARRPAPAGLYEPAAVPREVAQIIDEPAGGPASHEAGVWGGMPDAGPPSALLSDLMKSKEAPPPERPAPAAVVTKPEAPRRIVLVSQLEQGMLIDRVQPVYPPLAIQMRIEGTVVLRTIVGTDGRVKELVVVSGHPLLVQAAATAVRQWRYRPTVLNREAVEVVAPVEVHFKLAR